MTSKNTIILESSPLFKGLTQNEIKEALTSLSAIPMTYQKGSYLYHAGDLTSDFGLVLSGTIHIIKEDYWGNRTILSNIDAGNLFAEAYACAQSPLSVSVLAASECEIIKLDINALLTSKNQIAPIIHHNLMMILARKNVLLSNQITHLSQRRLRDKLLSYLSEQVKKQGSSIFDIPYNRQELADLLSVDRSALSAELSRLKQEGILDYHKHHFKLL